MGQSPLKAVAPSDRKVSFRPIDWLTRDIALDRRADGTIYMKSQIPLRPFEKHIPAFLDRWAQERPTNVWLAQRNTEGSWETLTYGEGKRKVDSVTQGLLDVTETKRPILILSGNSIEHAIVMIAAMQARIPVAPISPAYSLQSSDHAKLKHVFDLIDPGFIFVQDEPTFEKALDALNLTGVTVISAGRRTNPRTVALLDLIGTESTSAVGRSIASIEPETIGKLLFTSGSTGMPKAVVTTQRMMCANAAMIDQCRPLNGNPQDAKYLDWLPWNHVMGGNGVFNIVLSLGYSLYIDDGKPVPGQFDKTIRNLHDVSPISYTNAPMGFAALATALEQDQGLCRKFFQNLKLMTYGGARLPDAVFERIQTLAIKTVGERIVFTTTFGATETAPAATMTYWNTERVGLIGLPCPGVELKLLPVTDGKFEVRIRSVAITPGYHGQPSLTSAAFDEEGFYRIGDLVEFVDPDDPNEGLAFAGRFVEDFKLLSGTFVLVGGLRVDAVTAATPLLSDALVAGHDRDYVGLLAWLQVDACRVFIGDPAASIDVLARHPKIVEAVRSGIQAHNRASGNASSRRVARILLLRDPPSIDDNEITDKGYVNQKVGLARRGADVERLFAESPSSDVIVIPE